MKKININNWARKEHFEFYSDFDEPFFGIVSEVEVTNTLNHAKDNQLSFFACYLHKSLQVIHQIPEFRTRIVEGEVVEYDHIHASATIGRADNTFSFSFVPYNEDFAEFAEGLRKEIAAVQESTGMRLDVGSQRPDAVHYSSVPWIKFKGLTHARNFKFPDSCPKICFGKTFEEGGKVMMPISINAHHGLLDGWHVGKYLELFQEKLDGEEKEK